MEILFILLLFIVFGRSPRTGGHQPRHSSAPSRPPIGGSAVTPATPRRAHHRFPNI